MLRLGCFAIVLGFAISADSQVSFDYDIALEPVSVSGFNGLHSFAWAHHDGKWLLVGGRKDGIHARQPFNAFPESDNNTDLIVIDVESSQVWTSSVDVLPDTLSAQLQSTNSNFYQDGDVLYLIGGYGYSAVESDHITHPGLIRIDVPLLIDAIIDGDPVESFFAQIQNEQFAVTGGQVGKIGDTFYLVGGHRFDGRYNPMNHPTFTQTYTDQIRKFNIDDSGLTPVVSDYTEYTDAVNLHRRDYNLVPQIFPDGESGYMISSGVFQHTEDLPFLYPVDIRSDGHFPKPFFNQYLSNYHCPTVGLFDSLNGQMHTLFFGGISQYYFDGEVMVQDDNVPFVNTISLVTRLADGSLQESLMPATMPALQGAGAEFIPNPNLVIPGEEIIRTRQLEDHSTLLGHIVGGIHSNSANAFVFNQSELTSASAVIYRVILSKSKATALESVTGENPFMFDLYPNPTEGKFNISFTTEVAIPVSFMIMDSSGKILHHEQLLNQRVGFNNYSLELEKWVADGILTVTLIFNNEYFVSKKLIRD